MWIIRGSNVSIQTCDNLLHYLDLTGYDTMWIRYLWKLEGMTNDWCAKRCVEIINQYFLMIPDNLYLPELLYVCEGE